jgi:hypothetical protein
MAEKLEWRGVVRAVQPRIRLLRSFDQRHHNYLGYSLWIEGELGGVQRDFLLGIGKSAQEKCQFEAGVTASGLCEAVEKPQTETVEFYKASGIKIESRESEVSASAPPWKGTPVDLEMYRARGHRRLDEETYREKCCTCLWGCHMAVEVIVDQWNPRKNYRAETFCYGPKSCAIYKAGPTRKVPGRKGMRYTEENWVDEEATSHRGMEE